MPDTPHRTLYHTLTSRTPYLTSQNAPGFNPTGLFDVYIIQPPQGVLRASYAITTYTCSAVHWIVTNRIHTDIDTSEQPDISHQATKNPGHKVTGVMFHAMTCMAVFMSVRMSGYPWHNTTSSHRMLAVNLASLAWHTSQHADRRKCSSMASIAVRHERPAYRRMSASSAYRSE